jgi:hypothetical protein
MYIFFNNNPQGLKIGDCVVRAISAAMNQSWERTYVDLCIEGFTFRDMPNANNVWDSYLKSKGFKRYVVPNTCPDCYTVEDFVKDFPRGVYVLGFGGHVATVIDGDLYDSWNSMQEVPVYFWYRK